MRQRGPAAIGRVHRGIPGRRLGAAGPGSGPIRPIDEGGSNDGFTGPIVPMTAAHALGKGGYIDTWDGAGEQVSLDVAEWRVRRVFEQSPLVCSGNLGCSDGRHVGYHYAWQANILWDYRRPADSFGALRWMNGLEMVFWLGEILDRKMYRPPSTTKDLDQQPFLWCPEAAMEVSETMLNAIEKKMVRVPCQGMTRTHIFVCPAEGMPHDVGTVAGAYRQWYEKYGPENQKAGT